MLQKTIHLVIKALIIGVLINTGLQHVSTGPLPYADDTALRGQAPNQVPLNTEFHVTNQAEK
jgi:hypothetical protein